MQLNIKALSTHLKQHLLPAYLISSNETLLAEQARDQVIQEAKKQGFLEREIMHVDASFKWDHFLGNIQNNNLFASKTLIDLRNSTAKFDAQGINALNTFFALKNCDVLLIITTQKLTGAQQKSKWFKLFQTTGAYLPIYSMTTADYPRWIQKKATELSLRITDDAAKLLTQASEGNLFAAAQALEKCTLLFPNSTISPNEMASVISNNAQFTVFDLPNALLLGKLNRALKILYSLEQTGTEAILVLWAVTKEIRELLGMLYQIQRGLPMPQILSKVWASKKPLTQTALARLKPKTLENALQIASSIDQMIKGINPGNPWEGLQDLCLIMCNANLYTQAKPHAN